jgi:hypothetical protein
LSVHDNAAVLSSALQANWQLVSPALSDILWESTRVDSATFLQSCKNYAVCCYNPASPTSVAALSREAWQRVERVMVDVYVKAASTPEVAADTREVMKQEIYRIIHLKEFKIGPADSYVERESNKVEGPDLVRVTLQVACVDFHVQQ